MKILAKLVDVAFVVKEEKLDEFINHKKDDDKLKKVFAKAEKIKENITHME